MPGPDAESSSDASSPRPNHLTIAGSGESGAPEDYANPQDTANEEQGKSPHDTVQDENSGHTPGESVEAGGDAQRDVMKHLGQLAKSLETLAEGVHASNQKQDKILEKLDNPTGHPAPGQQSQTNTFHAEGNNPSGATPGQGGMSKSEGEQAEAQDEQPSLEKQAAAAQGQGGPEEQFVKNLDTYLTNFEKHIMSEVKKYADQQIKKAKADLQKSQGMQPMDNTPQPQTAAPPDQEPAYAHTEGDGSDLRKTDGEQEGQVPSFEELRSGNDNFGRLI